MPERAMRNTQVWPGNLYRREQMGNRYKCVNLNEIVCDNVDWFGILSSGRLLKKVFVQWGSS
jgi:hypothetical protein